MELLDRYLQAVKKHLPMSRQDDILNELRANLEAQLEDKETVLGRPLTQGEAEDWLRELGAPIQVAARYRPQQYLIGPGVFPTYWFVLRMVFLWATVIYLVVNATMIAVGTPSVEAVVGALLRIPAVLMTAAAWVTLIFAAIEFAVTHYPGKFPALAGVTCGWQPSTLPPLDEDKSGKKPRSFAQAVAEVVFGFLFLCWFLLVPKYPFLLLGPGALYLKAGPFQLADVWLTVFWWIVALNAVQLVWKCLDLWRGSWQRPARLAHIAYKIVGLVPLAILVAVPGNVFVLLKHPALDLERYGATLATINRTTYQIALLTCTIACLQLAWDVYQLAMASYRKREAAQ